MADCADIPLDRVAAANVQIAFAVKGGSARPSAISTPGSLHLRANNLRTRGELPAYRSNALLSWHRHGHDVIEWRKAMNRDYESDDVIELGAVSEATKGGPWGIDDFRGSLMLNDAGLTQD